MSTTGEIGGKNMRRLIRLTAWLTAFLLAVCFAVAVNAETVITMNGFSFYANADGEAVIVRYSGSGSRVEVPDSLLGGAVAEIADNAFFENGAMQEISFASASGLRKIGSNAFYGCTALTELDLPALDELGFGAFQSCSALRSVTVGEGLQRIEAQAFARCGALQRVVLPDSVTAIGEYAFAECGALSEVVLPPGVTEIADTAFRGCDNLTFACYWGSYAHGFAAARGIPFVFLDEILLGDADGSGAVNINDVTAVQRHCAELEIIDGVRQIAADVNNSGAVTVDDATMLQEYLAEYGMSAPIGEKIIW